MHPGKGLQEFNVELMIINVKNFLNILIIMNQELGLDINIRTEAERQFLNKLEGGCKLPIAVYSEI